jgi:ABC-type transport system substrate-binding protein
VIPQPLAQNREYLQTLPASEIAAAGQGDRILPRFDGAQSATPRNNYAGSNRTHYDNPRVTDLVEQFKITMNETERGRIFRQIADMVMEDTPLLPLFYTPTVMSVASGVRALDDIDGGHTGGGGYFGGYPRNAHLWEKD